MPFLKRLPAKCAPQRYGRRSPNIEHVRRRSSDELRFESLLIANRGEVACRIIETARRMGIRTVAVYSTADATSKHVKLADEAVFIGASAAERSYLDMDKILAAALSTGVRAVHPGYGFLSENANFAELLERESVTFVGPPARCISSVGDKLKAKELANRAGVSVIPGYEGAIMNVRHCTQVARSLGYPVMIKACAGGGGKGMRIARNDCEAREGYRFATEEAQSSFADDRVLIEKFLESPRHIEIQVLGDKHGNLVHLNERECSVQRRNQKILEEAPSTFLTPDMRIAMATQAVALCKEIGYYSAGTVEFLVDEQGKYYFLEMNTRLQVEHTVTEYVTGVDLVREMIRIAEGHTLNIRQEDVKIKGWAIESRIYAENPYRNLGSPAVGQVHRYKEPQSDDYSVKCDSGIEEGSFVDIYYDSLISKVICHGTNREEAIGKSVAALNSYVIFGINHNISLLQDILEEKRFISGHKLYPEQEKWLIAVAVGVYVARFYRTRDRISHSTPVELVVIIQDRHVSVLTFHNEIGLTVQIEGENIKMEKDIYLGQILLDNLFADHHEIMQLHSHDANGEIRLVNKGTICTLKVMAKVPFHLLRLIPSKFTVDPRKIIISPMPGLLKSISCKIDDHVVEGQELCVIEAMKMQNSIASIKNGKIKRVHVQAGDVIGDDQVLVELQ